jgi:hypothetical protein
MDDRLYSTDSAEPERRIRIHILWMMMMMMI